jgi:SAM-dependent methyltransferase
VDDYVRARPTYPPAALDFLAAGGKLSPGNAVADVGSGTGILTRLLIDRGLSVFAVEPNPAMRRAAQDALGAHPNFHSVDGRAEATGLPDASVRMVAAAQAFHWFEPEATRMEFRRILALRGTVALLWNERLTGPDPFSRDYEGLLLDFGTDYRQVDHRRIDATALERFFGRAPVSRAFPHVQSLDRGELCARLLSSSYTPAAGIPGHAEMLEELGRLFDRHQVSGRVTMMYDCHVHIGWLDNLRMNR